MFKLCSQQLFDIFEEQVSNSILLQLIFEANIWIVLAACKIRI